MAIGAGKKVRAWVDLASRNVNGQARRCPLYLILAVPALMAVSPTLFLHVHSSLHICPLLNGRNFNSPLFEHACTEYSHIHTASLGNLPSVHGRNTPRRNISMSTRDVISNVQSHSRGMPQHGNTIPGPVLQTDSLPFADGQSSTTYESSCRLKLTHLSR